MFKQATCLQRFVFTFFEDTEDILSNICLHVFKKCLLGKPFLADYIKPLTYIINKSFETGIFPYELKITKIVPIFKSGDKTLVPNYRPISVLGFFSKIFETILYNHLIEFIEKHDLLYKFQFGFRKQFSTSHAIISLVDKIHEALNSSNIMIGVTLDFSKAFDTIQISILLKKLYSYGIRGIT